jgi:hypothetical protein
MSIHLDKNPRQLSPAEKWAQRIVTEQVRAMDPIDRIARMDDMYRAAEEMARIQLAERYPTANEDEIKLRLAALRYGREFTMQWFGWDPEVRGW